LIANIIAFFVQASKSTILTENILYDFSFQVSRLSAKTMSTLTQSSVLRDLYPEIEPFNMGFLKVSDLHEIYYEESGNKNGKPAVYL
jgi:hypothetical protein